MAYVNFLSRMTIYPFSPYQKSPSVSVAGVCVELQIEMSSSLFRELLSHKNKEVATIF